MSKNTVFVPLCVGSLVAVTVSGCFFVEDEDCSIQDYCSGNKVWTVEGTGEWSGCEEYVREDCSETGRVCLEYGDRNYQEAGCYYPETTCDTDVQARCDGDFVYQCDSNMNVAVERESCAETGRVCREYTDETGQNAGCFYEDTSCEVVGEDAGFNEVCDGDIAYVCNPDAAMASKRKDCSETDDICVEVESWGAVCTTACTDEGERTCNRTAIMIVRCSNGTWIPEQTCGQNTYCAEVEQDGATEPRCVEEFQDDTLSPNKIH